MQWNSASVLLKLPENRRHCIQQKLLSLRLNSRREIRDFFCREIPVQISLKGMKWGSNVCVGYEAFSSYIPLVHSSGFLSSSRGLLLISRVILLWDNVSPSVFCEHHASLIQWRNLICLFFFLAISWKRYIDINVLKIFSFGVQWHIPHYRFGSSYYRKKLAIQKALQYLCRHDVSGKTSCKLHVQERTNRHGI